MVPTDDMLLISRSVKWGSERNLHLKTSRKPIKEPTNSEVKPETYMKHLYTIQQRQTFGNKTRKMTKRFINALFFF